MHARSTARLVAATLAALAPAAAARGQTVLTDPGVAYNATALTGFSTTGSDMLGLRVTAFFTDGRTSSESWADLGGGSTGVANTWFNVLLGAGDDTFGSAWRVLDFTGVGINRLVFSGAPGKTVFDILAFPETSPGSASGSAVSILGGDAFGTTATYRNRVGIGGAAPLGDLYETLDLSFTTAVGANGMQFIADTDNIGVRGTITTTPEPATFGLLATGALGILGAGWRRRRATA